MTQTQTQDVIAVLIQDHREVEEMFVRLEELNGDANDEAKTVAEQVVMDLVRHSVAEDEVLYTQVELVDEYGPDITDVEAELAAGALTARLAGVDEGVDDPNWGAVPGARDPLV